MSRSTIARADCDARGRDRAVDSSKRIRDCPLSRCPTLRNNWPSGPGTPRDTAGMKLQATIVISYRADSFSDAGAALDDVLQRAREREDVEINSIQLGTPASVGPVSLPYVERPAAAPQPVPHPPANGDRD
jgi:hypothetical protein